jgi:hypothetical protein
VEDLCYPEQFVVDNYGNRCGNSTILANLAKTN